jgi:hypothetical protein
MRSPISLSILPVLERALQHELGHAFLQVSDDIGNQTVALCIVHNFPHQGAGLAAVIVILPQSVSGSDDSPLAFQVSTIG